jgi:hypothetical protein
MWLLFVLLLLLLVMMKPGYQAPPIFLSRQETQNFLDYDPDGFIRSLTMADLVARHTDDYFGKISRSALEFTPDEKNDIIKKISTIKEFEDIQWKFALVDSDYEQGWPHTRQDVIFLSRPIPDAETLLHEKIHIFERRYPEKAEKMLSDLGFTKTSTLIKNYSPLVRSNPDVDMYVWLNKQGVPMVALYNSENPRDMGDTNGEDHPYEYLAYTLRT